MPELPEVETVRRALDGPLRERRLTRWAVRNPNLRWPVSIPESLRGARLLKLSRVAKYLLFDFDAQGQAQYLIAHLGMSGSFRLLKQPGPPGKHDHIDLIFEDLVLRYRDPRRFGSLHFSEAPVHGHFLLHKLGVEPLSANFDGAYLHTRSRKRRIAVKQFIMDASILTGIGNIYASESLFEARIRPATRAGKIGKARYERLSDAIKLTLGRAIKRGGTTLKDFYSSDGEPGYFTQDLSVYGRAGEACDRCGTRIRKIGGARSTFYCPGCQT